MFKGRSYFKRRIINARNENNSTHTRCEYEKCVCTHFCLYLCVCVYGVRPLHRELSRIRDHDAFVSQQAECAHRQLAGALEQTNTNSESVPHSSELNNCSFSPSHIFIKLTRSKIHITNLIYLVDMSDSFQSKFICTLQKTTVKGKIVEVITYTCTRYQALLSVRPCCNVHSCDYCSLNCYLKNFFRD